MKKIYTLFCLLFFCSFGFSQWTQLNSGTSNHLYHADFTDTLTGYVVGGNGTILKTINAGNTWTNLPSGTSEFLLNVKFITPTTGYAVGQNGTFLKTTNAGNTWTLLPKPITTDISKIVFTDSLTAYLLEPYSVLKSTDAGNTWNTIISGLASPLAEIYFLNKDTGFVSGRNGTLLRTYNAGNTWTPVPSGANTTLTSIRFTSANTGYIVGDYDSHGTILKTTDGGNTWTFAPGIPSIYFYSVDFKGQNMGYIVGNGNIIFKTTDAGASWQQEYAGFPIWFLNHVCFTNANTAYTFGADGTILKTSVFASVKEKQQTLMDMYPNPACDKITIQCKKPSKEAIITILDMNGKEIRRNNFKDKMNIEINVADLAKGIYFIKIQLDNSIEMQKLVLE